MLNLSGVYYNVKTIIKYKLSNVQLEFKITKGQIIPISQYLKLVFDVLNEHTQFKTPK